MSRKSFKELAKLSPEEMKLKLRDLDVSFFRLKMQHKTGQLENSAALWNQRKAIASLNTLLKRAELEKSSVRSES